MEFWPVLVEEAVHVRCSAAAFSSVSSVLMGTGLAEQAPASRFLTWKQRRADILKQYAVTGQIKIQSDLLNVDGVAAASLGSNLDDGAKAAEKKVERAEAGMWEETVVGAMKAVTEVVIRLSWAATVVVAKEAERAAARRGEGRRGEARDAARGLEKFKKLKIDFFVFVF